MSRRCNIVPDPRFAELHAALADRLAQVGGTLEPGQFASLLDPMSLVVLARGFKEAGAHEGTVWVPDLEGTHLLPAFNTGPNADRIVGHFRQPLSAGIVSMTFALEQPFLENEVFKNSRQSKLLDQELGQQTYALIVVPLHFLKACRGVVSCVQLKTPGSSAPDPSGFQPEHLLAVQHAVGVLSRLLELRLLGEVVGWPVD